MRNIKIIALLTVMLFVFPQAGIAGGYSTARPALDRAKLTPNTVITAYTMVMYDEIAPSLPFSLILALYEADGRLSEIAFSEGGTVDITDMSAPAVASVSLNLPAGTDGMYLKAFSFDGKENIRPLRDGEIFFKGVKSGFDGNEISDPFGSEG